MPQVVVCSRCQQRFMAPDELLGKVVPCPACGSAISIPTLDSLAQQPLASPLSARTLPAAGFSRSLGSDQQQRTLILVIVGAICLVWLLLAAPNVLLWAAGRPAATLQKVGAGAVLFWIGGLAASGGLLEWSFFMNSRKMQVIRQWFGDRGAKWFYAGVGSVVVLMGLGVTGSATVYSLFGTTINSQETPDFTAPQAPRQPLAGPQVGAPPPPAVVATAPPPPPATADAATAPPPADAAPAASASEVAVQPVADQPPPIRKEFSELPGTWRQLQGGYCIKVPAAIKIDRDTVSSRGDDSHQDFGGCTDAGNPHGVNFAVHVNLNSRNEKFEMDTRFLFGLKQRQPLPQELSCELLVVNGLDVMKTTTQNTQTGAVGKRTYTLNGTTYQFADRRCTISMRVYSELPLDHADQKAIGEYLNTFQRMPDAAAATAAADSDQSVGTWQLLEGGFRIRTSPAALIRVNEITRRGRDQEETSHHWHGQTADGVQFKVDVLYSPAWNHVNEARKIAADRSARPRPDYEHVAVEVNGLVMQRITRLPRSGRSGPTILEYKFVEGQHQIEMSATSKLPLDHASFQTVVGLFKSIQRVPR